jgi:D-aminoacyl-tRNA deacylase
MIALIQRVLSARVDVENDHGEPETVGAIGPGLLALVAVQPDDGEAQTKRMLERLLGYRVFADDAGKMNRSLADTGGGLLLVSQFTLAADTRSGMRPSFTSAASPEHGRRWFEHLVELAKSAHSTVEIGRFGAHMQVHLVNDGPVTFWLDVR